MKTESFEIRNLKGAIEKVQVRTRHNNGEYRNGAECGPAVNYFAAETYKTTKGRLIVRFISPKHTTWFEVRDFTRKTLEDLFNWTKDGAWLSLE